ncbi:MAG: ribosome small subunit-dependent GTPase A [Ruminococcus sp.]|nr:ribosome small subunit-dependent GTPase A [Ruminococcus sp.]
MQGIVTKLIGGTYSVCASDTIYECKARGVFRKKGISPVCGDNVEIETQGDIAVITKVLERKSFIVRPPLANLDCLVLVNSVVSPSVNLELVDKFSAVAVHKGIEPIIVFTKTDLKQVDELYEIYESCGFKTFCINNNEEGDALPLKSYLQGKISAFTGNTGVGKSSLINNMFGEILVDTNEISQKLGRGKHTTRHTELYPIEGGGYIADTPGFSTFETNRYEIIKKEELQYCFPEFDEHLGKCRFLDCTHTSEPDCAVIQAVEEGVIKPTRYQSYKKMYEEAKSIKEWEIK